MGLTYQAAAKKDNQGEPRARIPQEVSGTRSRELPAKSGAYGQRSDFAAARRFEPGRTNLRGHGGRPRSSHRSARRTNCGPLAPCVFVFDQVAEGNERLFATTQEPLNRGHSARHRETGNIRRNSSKTRGPDNR